MSATDKHQFPDVGNVNVLVVGDIMLDQYWFGDVARISPEAPVPIVNVKHEEQRCGGAANVALNIASMGANCRMMSVAGDDIHADKLEKILLDAGVEVYLSRSATYKTTVKQRVIAQNQQLLRLDFEDRPKDEILARCLNSYSDSLSWADVIILSDYGKGGLDHVAKMIQLAREQKVPVIIDPKGRDYSKYNGASLITPNMSEFGQVVGDFTEKDMDEKAFQLVESLSLDGLLVTMSEKGMMLYNNRLESHFSPARAIEVYDVSGAGDTVIATIALMKALNATAEISLIMANAAASVVVAKLGTATATPDEINEVLNQENH